MKEEPIFVAFSTQKGGVGKTTFTVLAASYLHYIQNYNVAVVDCDYPQHSIQAMRKRDAEQVDSDDYYKQMAYIQFKELGKKAYPILCSSPSEAINATNRFLEQNDKKFDVVFFDLPGTVNSPGVLQSLAEMDYIFTPITADRVVLESSLSFALSIHELLVTHPQINLKGLFLFWNMVDGREKTDLYNIYEKSIHEFGLPLLQTFIPDTKRYKKELSNDRKAVFRSTLFPADKRLLKGSCLEELLIEIAHTIQL
jgi:cellulose biosynthesis protein BcsQ